jgi:hypothetical protein
MDVDADRVRNPTGLTQKQENWIILPIMDLPIRQYRICKPVFWNSLVVQLLYGAHPCRVDTQLAENNGQPKLFQSTNSLKATL